MKKFFQKIFDAADFMPHGHCYFWKPEILWTNVGGDAMIALAYFTLPPMLFVLARKRSDLTHKYVFVLFGIFILACGTTHLIDIWTVWVPTYRIEGIVKIFTGFVSLLTAFFTLKSLPVILALPSRQELEDANQALLHEVGERKKAEEALTDLNQQLEKRVKERTADLVIINQELEKQVEQRRAAQLDLQDKNKQLTRTNTDLDNFVYSASHGLKAPIINIEGLLQALEDEIRPDNLAGQRIVQHLRTSVFQTRHIIQDLSDFSRLDHADFALTDVPLQPLLDEVLNEFDFLIDKLQAQVVIDIERLPVVRFSHYHLQVILHNLISNALKFSKPGQPPFVQIEAYPENNWAVFAVGDKGLGIDLEKDKNKIFGMFKRLHVHTTGSGMGLYLVKRIVESCGGKISVESRIAEGATFFVYLPMHTPDHQLPL